MVTRGKLMSSILYLAWTSLPALVAGLGFVSFLFVQTKTRTLETTLLGVVLCLFASTELFAPRNSSSPFSLVLSGSLGEVIVKIYSQWNELAALMSFVIYFLVLASLKIPEKFNYDRSWIFFIVILLGTILISGMHANELVNRYYLMAGVSFIAILLSLEKLSYREKMHQIRMALRFTLSMSVLALAIAPEWATTRDWVGGLFETSPRFQGITIHPNVLGILCVILFAIEKGNSSRSSRYWQLLSLATIIGTGSRAALVATVVAMFVWKFPRVFSSKKTIITSALLISLSAVVIPNLAILAPLLQPRAVSFQSALDTWKSSIFIGVGPFPKDELGISQVLFPHNQVLYLLSLGGLFLIGIFIALLINSGIKISLFENGKNVVYYYIFLVLIIFDNIVRISNINFLFASLSVIMLLVCPNYKHTIQHKDRITALGVENVKIT